MYNFTVRIHTLQLHASLLSSWYSSLSLSTYSPSTKDESSGDINSSIASSSSNELELYKDLLPSLAKPTVKMRCSSGCTHSRCYVRIERFFSLIHCTCYDGDGLVGEHLDIHHDLLMPVVEEAASCVSA